MAETREPVRCHCRRSPIIAFWGFDKQGRAYVHVKVYKQEKIFAETVHYSGTVEIRCRECFRWTRIRLRAGAERVSPPRSAEPDILQSSLLAAANDRKIG